MNTEVTNTEILTFRRRHPDPIVEKILNTDPSPEGMFRTFINAPLKQNPKLNAIAAMLMAESGLGSYDTAEKLAQEAYQIKSHVDLQIMFLAMWYDMLLHLDVIPFDQLKALETALDALVSSETPEELKGIVTFEKSHTSGFVGDFNRQFKLIEHVVDGIPNQSPYYAKLMAMKIMVYRAHGKGEEVEHLLTTFKVQEFDRAGLIYSQVTNSVLTGQIKLASVLLEQLRDIPRVDYLQMLKGHSKRLNALVSLMLLTTGEESFPVEPLSIDNQCESWVRSTQALIERKPKDALHWARLYIEEENTYIGPPLNFVYHTLVRAELASGNGRAAKRLLEDLNKRGSETILDSFYLARAERLLGNQDLAASHFAEAKKQIDKYQAHGRFDFEVQLANELGASDLLSLGLASLSVSSEAITKTRKLAEKTAKGLSAIISLSPEIENVKRLISRFATFDQPVLVTGETGTGKELVARALHDLSDRNQEPFMAINCAAIPDALIESELFGHASGAFTGAVSEYKGIFREAKRGTVFLDEIGDISPRLQLALLRVLETGEIRAVGDSTNHKIQCRVVAATNKDLLQRSQTGQFPSDLYFRLQRLEIYIPPLRSREADIQILLDYFLNLNRETNASTKYSKEFIDKLKTYHWPGNVRELRNLVEKLRILSSDKLYYDEIDLTDNYLSPPEPQIISNEIGPDIKPVNEIIEVTNEINNFLINGQTALRRKNSLRTLFDQVPELKVSEAAAILRISRKTASRYLSELCTEGYIQKITPNGCARSHYYLKASDKE